MATAIVRVYTTDGFIISADGREMEDPGARIVTEERQKIFQAGTDPIAYSATGHTMLGDVRETTLETVRFNFNAHLAEQSTQVSGSNFDRMEDFAREICWPIYEALVSECKRGNVDLTAKLGGPGRGETILAVFFDGYLRQGVPGSATVRFFHEGEIPQEPEVFLDNLGEVHRYGSLMVEAEMLSGNKFDRYKQPIPSSSIQSSDILNRMIQASVSFIRACSSPEGQVLDPAKCRSVGGHIHVARITPSVGFRWIPGFAPVSSSSSER